MTTTYAPKVEMYVNSTWTDVSGDVQYGKQITMTRGRDSEGGQGQPSTCTFQLDNRSDNYSPLNPSGAYYGTLGRNTPVRVSLTCARGVRLVMASSTSGVASCADSAGTSITGDIDLRADVWLKSWNYNGQVYPVYKEQSYQLSVKDGRLLMIWQQTSNVADVITVTSTARVPLATSGRLSVRATLDVDNGASGNTVTFYTSTTTGTAGPWTQLGSPVVTSGVTQIWDSTHGLAVYGGSFSYMEAFSAAAYSGIAGTLKANPIFSAQASGTTSFADAQGNTWTVNATGARIDNRDYRFWGEISELIPTEDASGKDRRADVVAAGPLRRILAGTTVTESAMDHGVKALSGLVAWWPGEDGASATGFASGVQGQNPLAVYGTVTFGTTDAAFPGTSSVVTLSNSMRARTYGLASYTNTGQTQFRFLLKVPGDGGFLNDTVLWRFFTTGTAKRWDLVYTTTGTGGLYLKAYDDTGLIYTGGAASYNLLGVAKWVTVQWTQLGGDIVWEISTLDVGANLGLLLSDTFTSQTFGNITQMYFNWDLNDFSDGEIGQIVLTNNITDIFTLYQEVNAYLNEQLTVRFRRYITTELGLLAETVGGVGLLSNTLMGFQQQKTLGDLLREIEYMDGGIMSDMRSFGPGVQYRTRRSMYGQDTALTLVYTGGNDPYALEATQDDRATANDVTVNRVGGSSSNVTQATGSLNTQEPPAGVGRYAQQFDLSLGSDSDTYNHAGWRLHLGTVDEPRWTNIEVWGERSEVSDIQERLAALELGDRVTVTNVPTRRLPWDIDAIVYGITETLDQFSWRFKLVSQPERPWHVLEWSTDRRWSPVNSALNANITSAATSFAVKTNSGSLWTTTDVPFDIMIGGERITVTAVTGSSSPQTFTVTRAVNGVSKAHNANDAVTLWDPSYWAL